jgi:hypothetical protein
MGRGPASFSIVPGGPPGPSIGLPDACPGPSRRGRVPFCRRDSTRPQNASGLIPIPPGNGFPALLPSPLMSASPAPSFPGSPGIGETGLRDRASARIGGGSHPGALFQPRFGVRGDSRKRPAQGKQGGRRAAAHPRPARARPNGSPSPFTHPAAYRTCPGRVLRIRKNHRNAVEPCLVLQDGVLRLSPGSRTWRGSFPRSRPEKFGRARSPPPVHTLSDTTNDTTDDTISDTTNGTARL